jgi:hypothetical protein
VSGRAIEIVEGAGGGGGLGIASLGFVSGDFEMLTGRPPTSVQELLVAGLP